MKKGDVVEVVRTLSVGFPEGTRALIHRISERGDFVLERLFAEDVPEGCSRREGFGYAYRPYVRVVEELRGEKEIRESKLETFDNPHLGVDYMVSILLPEFTCKCPKSGYPDFAHIHLQYVPGARCVELKSIKLYCNSFRDTYQFHEDVMGKIFRDLKDLLSPKWIKVVGNFSPRGNVHTRVVFEAPLLSKDHPLIQLAESTPPVKL